LLSDGADPHFQDRHWARGTIAGDVSDRVRVRHAFRSMERLSARSADQAADLLASAKEPMLVYHPKAVGSPKNDCRPQSIERKLP